MTRLPRVLEDAVAARLAAADGRTIARTASALSERYRERAVVVAAENREGAERIVAERLAASPEQILAYAGLMLPATHAQIDAALRMVPRRAPEFAPRTHLDLGSGPGTAGWAVSTLWPELQTCVALEREPAFLKLARELAAESPSAALRECRWIQGSLPADVPPGTFDLVTVGHVLGEMEEHHALGAVDRAWAACAGVLVIVEPGTPAGFVAMEAARRRLIGLGAYVLAPCPHAAACPLADGPLAEPPDWCHFSERTERPPFQVRLKSASLPWEDAKLSFVAVSRTPSVAVPWARVLRHPWHAKGRVELRLCSREGLLDRHVRKSDPDWKLARGLEWGSAIEEPLVERG